MPGAPFLETDRTALRTVEREDLDWMQGVVSDDRVWGWGTYPQPVNADQLADWYEETFCDDDSVQLLVCVGEDGDAPVSERTDPVGLVAMNDHDPEQSIAELAYWLDPEAWGKGYATEAAGRLVRFGFEQRALRKWKAKVVDGNDSSVAVLERLGFEREGTHRAEWYLDGEYRDTLWFGLFRDDQ